MSGPLRLGLIGCGRIAQAAHLPALAKTDAIELVAVCDPSERLASAVAQRHGARPFTDSDALLAAPVHAVLIAAPDRFHADLGAAALRAGKHVLMEKPLAASSRAAERLVELASERDLRLQTGAMKRHDPGLAFAHRHLPRIGDIVSYASVYRVPAARPAIEATLFPADLVVDDDVAAREQALKQDANRSSYLLATHGAHVFDTLCHFTGRPRWISARTAVVAGDHTWHGQVGLPSGGLGSFEITVDVHADWAERFEIFGSAGHISADTYQPFWKRASDVAVYTEEDGVSLRPHPADTDAFKLQLEHFAAAVAAGGGESPRPEDGVWPVRLIEAALDSAAHDGATVRP